MMRQVLRPASSYDFTPVAAFWSKNFFGSLAMQHALCHGMPAGVEGFASSSSSEACSKLSRNVK